MCKEIFNRLYKGFVQGCDTVGDEKKPAVKYSIDKNHRTYQQLEHHNNILGVLKKDVLIVDCDSNDHADKFTEILEHLNITVPTLVTTRGKHFYFKVPLVPIKSKAHLVLACGLIADIKTGASDSIDCIKYKGVEREWLNEDAQLIELPKFAYPIALARSANNPNGIDTLLNLADGDGRNDALYNFIIPMIKATLTKSDVKFIYKNIINDLVLKTPLQEKELLSILRDESFDKLKVFKVGKDFQYDAFTKNLILEHHISRINGGIWFYEKGAYKLLTDEAIGYLVSKEIKDCKENLINEVRHKIKYETFNTEEELAPSSLICFNNGVYNLENDTILEHTPILRFINKIPHDYNPNAYDEHVDKMLNLISCNDSEVRQLFEEMIGYTLFSRCEMGKAFILVGEGSNGKSTLLHMIGKALGVDNITNLDLKDLNHNFRPALLQGKMLNLGDDISDDYLGDTAMFKKLVTGDPVILERKGKDPFMFINSAKFIFSANDLPRVKNFGTAIHRRLVIVPCNADFSVKQDDFDPFIKDKVSTTNAAEYLLKIAIGGLKRVLTNGTFTTPEVVSQALFEYEAENNPVQQFFEANEGLKLDNEPTENVYKKFRDYCLVNGITGVYNKSTFIKRVKKIYPFLEIKVKKVDGKCYRIFSFKVTQSQE